MAGKNSKNAKRNSLDALGNYVWEKTATQANMGIAQDPAAEIHLAAYRALVSDLREMAQLAALGTTDANHAVVEMLKPWLPKL